MATTTAIGLTFLLLIAGAVGVVATGPPGQSDLAVDVSVDRHGSQLRAWITVDNEGPEAAKNVRLHLKFDDGPWRMETGRDACNGAGKELVCKRDGMASGGRWTLSAVYDDADCSETTGVEARVHAPHDSNRDNNEAEAKNTGPCGTTEPPPGTMFADVAVTKVGARVQATVRFTMTVTNLGTHDAHEVTLWDPLPAVGVRWIKHGPDADACAIRGQELTCAWPVVWAGDTKTVSVTALGAECGSVGNTAYVDARDDTNPDNNRDSAYVPRACSGHI